MQYMNLGRSSLKVSRLSLGAMGIGDPSWRRWVLTEDDARPVVRRALDHGINMIDTCDYYSLGRSEEVIGGLLRNFVSRHEIVLATKVGNPMSKGPNGRGFSRKHLFEAVDASLKRLGTEYIDLYQTHIWDPATNIAEMVIAFDDLVRSGKVHYVGATDMPAWQFAKSVYLAEHNGLTSFVSMQNHYNPIWREDERELIPLCRHEGIGLIPYSPMARGFLCGRARRIGERETVRLATDDYAQKLYGRKADHAVGETIEAIAARRGVEPAQVSLAWTLARPGVDSAIFGATAEHHVDSAVAALELTLDTEDVQAIDAAYEPRAAVGHGI